MAVLSKFSGLTVDVLVNGIPRAEHEPSIDEATKDDASNVTRYIEAESGSNFEIRVRINKAFKGRYNFHKHDLCIYVWIDGLQSQGRLVKKETIKLLKNEGQTELIKGVNMGSGTDWKMRKFTFSDLVAGKHTYLSAS
jgi:hypothetical protein